MQWREKVSNTDVSNVKSVHVFYLLSNFDCLKSVSKFSQGMAYDTGMSDSTQYRLSQ